MIKVSRTHDIILLDDPVNDLLLRLLTLFNQTCLEVTDVVNAHCCSTIHA